jgi:hypothetical protein
MSFVESDVLLGTGPDALDNTSLHQSLDGQLDGTEMLASPTSEFANRHRFAGVL